MKQSLKSRLSLTITLIVLITVIIIGALANWFIKEQFNVYVEKQLREKTEDMIQSLEEQYNKRTGSWNLMGVQMVGIAALNEGVLVTLFDEEGNTIWDAEDYNLGLCTQIMDEICERMQQYQSHSDGEVVTIEKTLLNGTDAVGSVEVKHYGPYFLSENDFEFLNALNQVFFIIGALALIVTIIVSRLLAKNISRPILKAITITKYIAEGEYEDRLKENNSIKELDELSHSINRMAASIEKQENLRKQLTADMAHELRTPLTTVSTHLEAMLTGIWDITEERLESCYEEINRITLLVTDLERLAKVEDGNYPLHPMAMDLYGLVSKIKDNMQYQMKEKNLHVSISGESFCIQADQDRIAQVVINIVSNAIKYTPEGGYIFIKVYQENEFAVLEVKDTGLGIAKEDLPYIFERFYRADKSRNRKTGGVGIGLSIANSIVRGHGGKIEVMSELGEGSTFKISLPYSQEKLLLSQLENPAYK